MYNNNTSIISLIFQTIHFRNKDCVAAITTSEGKFYTTGMDIEWRKLIAKRDPTLPDVYIKQTDILLRRMATFPLPLIAAINGKVCI